MASAESPDLQAPRADWDGGWWRGARSCESPNCGPRPGGLPISLVVIHSISLPPGQYGGDGVERLFTNRLDWDAHPYYQVIRGLQVSSHFFISRSGEPIQFVSCDQRAWHAGQSSWRGRPNCNDYSIGIELEGLEGDRFELQQYATLVWLLRAIASRYPVEHVAGHEHVAPGRKIDPGPGFDWRELQCALQWPPTMFAALDHPA